jgi:hypothetical protein
MDKETKRVITFCVVLVLLVLSTIGGCAVGWPKYRVWQREMSGKAQLAEAEWNRQIAVKEAEAKKFSATELAEAEIIRAGGVAEANKIIGESLQGNDAYLRYLWIQGLHDGTSEIIYVPTEAQLPILEAGRLGER